MSCQIDFEICTCDCHSNPNVRHVMACCYVCPHCGNNIERAFYTDHVNRCKRETENLLEELGEAIGGYSSEQLCECVRKALHPQTDDFETVLEEAQEMVQQCLKEKSPVSK